MTEAFLFWGLGLLGLSMILVVLELFIPSMGILGILSALSAIAGIVMLFKHDTTWGLLGLVGVLLLGPLMFGFAVRVWPYTPIGRRMIQGTVTDEDLEQAKQQRMHEQEARLALVGAEGEAITDLRPVGVVRIGDQRLDGLAEAGFIESGQRVRVVSVGDNQIKVRAAT